MRSRTELLPVRAAFPDLKAGRHPFRYFRGLLKLHSRYGLQSCSPTIRGLYREASPGPVSRPVRSQANKSYRQLLVRVLPPLVIRAFGAHFKFLRFYVTADTQTVYNRIKTSGFLPETDCLDKLSDGRILNEAFSLPGRTNISRG